MDNINIQKSTISKKNKLLVICGPTSTGKTSLAIHLAKKFNGELVSADSRQVYKNMDIGTGKDLPPNAKIKYPFFSKYGYYLMDGIKVWGYDLADSKDEFNVSWYLTFANKIISDIQKKGKLPILVGGTGLYIKGVLYGIPTLEIPKNEKLRTELETRNVASLYETLSQLDSFKAGSMNSSDKKNPRRLIRAIEVAQWKLGNGPLKTDKSPILNFNSVLEIGLSAPAEFIDKKINQRINDRVASGIKEEIKKLLKLGVDWESQSMASIGYRQWRDNFEGGVDEATIVEEWGKEERKYARRQMTWFKKDSEIRWFNILEKSFLKNVEKLTENWYNS